MFFSVWILLLQGANILLTDDGNVKIGKITFYCQSNDIL